MALRMVVQEPDEVSKPKHNMSGRASIPIAWQKVFGQNSKSGGEGLPILTIPFNPDEGINVTQELAEQLDTNPLYLKIVYDDGVEYAPRINIIDEELLTLAAATAANRLGENYSEVHVYKLYGQIEKFENALDGAFWMFGVAMESTESGQERRLFLIPNVQDINLML